MGPAGICRTHRMTTVTCLLLAAVILVGNVTAQRPTDDEICLKEFVKSSRGRVFVMVHQLHPINVKVIEYVKMEFCTDTEHGFYLQVWRKLGGTNYREYELLQQTYINRTQDTVEEDPVAYSQLLYKLTEPIDLTQYDEATFQTLHIGLFVPFDRTTRGLIPVRGQHHRHFLVDRTYTPETEELEIHSTNRWRDLGYPFYFVMTICKNPTVSTCILPEACGVPGHALVRRRPVPFTDAMNAIMVDFCARRASIEVSLLARSETAPGEYESVWSLKLQHQGASIRPLVINLPEPVPLAADTDIHMAVKNLDQPEPGKLPSLPVRYNFSDNDVSWVSLDSRNGFPTRLDTLLLYPYFFRVSVCAHKDCINSTEAWVKETLALVPPHPVSSGTTPGSTVVGSGPTVPGLGTPGLGPGTPGVGGPLGPQTPGAGPGTPGVGGPLGPQTPGAGPGTPGVGGPLGPQTPGAGPGRGGPLGPQTPGSGPRTPGSVPGIPGPGGPGSPSVSPPRGPDPGGAGVGVPGQPSGGVNGSRAGGVLGADTTTVSVVTSQPDGQATTSVLTVFKMPPLPGLAGPVGVRGPAGPVGPEGGLGPEGPTGTQGRPGSAGARGFRGLKGDLGFLGPEGGPGTGGGPGGPGQDGFKGARGGPGERGRRGEHGPPGGAGRPAAAAAVSSSSSSSSTGSRRCGCDGFINRRVVLGLVVWCVLLTLLVVILLAVSYRNAKAERDAVTFR